MNMNMKLKNAFIIGNSIKNNLIPNAVQYYFGLIDISNDPMIVLMSIKNRISKVNE